MSPGNVRRHKLTSGNRHVVSPAATCRAPATHSGLRRRQGEGRGAVSFGAGVGYGRRRQGTRGAERRRAVRAGLGRQDRHHLARAAGARRGLPLRDPLLPGQQAGALRARRRRSVPDLRGARTACDGARRRDRQEADCRHHARRELLSRGPPHSRRRGHQQVLRYPELGARGELQHHQRRAPRQQGRSPPRSRRRSLSLQSVSSGRGGRTAAAASA